MAQHNFNKKDSGLNYVKEILAKKHTKQKETEELEKRPNPYNKTNRPQK